MGVDGIDFALLVFGLLPLAYAGEAERNLRALLQCHPIVGSKGSVGVMGGSLVRLAWRLRIALEHLMQAPRPHLFIDGRYHQVTTLP